VVKNLQLQKPHLSKLLHVFVNSRIFRENCCKFHDFKFFLKKPPSLFFRKQTFFQKRATTLLEKSRKTMKKPEFFPFFYEKVLKNSEKSTNLPSFFDPLAQN
jgi:hypothetical protein